MRPTPLSTSPLRALCALAFTLVVTAPTFARAELVDGTSFEESAWLFTASDITGMAFAPDGSGRLFLIRKGGSVRIVQRNPGGGATLLPDPFVTISPVFTNSECGLIGLAFDPDFVSNGYVYFFVTVSSSEQQIIRYTATGNTGGDKTTIVPNLPTVGENHDGGGVGFGEDGMLYWGIGDLGNGTGVNADLASLAAKIGRARRDGSVPGDNPFVDGPGGNNDYVFARGMRNPFTLTFQPTTDLLWVNVVGTSYEQVFVVRAGDHAGYNDYENDQPAGFITPTVAYRTGSARLLDIEAEGAARSGGVITFTTSTPHRLRQGERVVVSGVSDAGFNGTFYVAEGAATPIDQTFTVLQAGPDTASGGGMLSTMNQGRAVSGGTFYDATAFPAAYRGNFFYGDYVSGRAMRAVVGPGTTVVSVDYWSTGLNAPIDQAVGPDGALYTASYGGNVYRTRYLPSAQGLVVSQQHVRVLEGGAAVFSVSLAQMPSADVTVTVARSGGDTDVSVADGASLTFTAANWMDPQPVRVAAALDADGEPDVAALSVSSAGLSSVEVEVRVTDASTLVLMVSHTSLTIPEGGERSFSVRLADAPASDVIVSVVRASGDADVTVSAGATLTFTPANYATPQTVTLAAAEDDDASDDVAIVEIRAEGAATRTLQVSVVDNDGTGLDAGIGDGGAGGDGGRLDAGVPRGASRGGCGCRVLPREGASASTAPLLGLALLALLAWRRRVRA